MASFDSVNPAHPDQVIGTYPEAGPAEVDAAVQAAAEAQREWARLPVPARAELIGRAGDELAARKKELSELVTREVGKVLVEAGGDVQEAIDMAHFMAGQGRHALGEFVPSELADKVCFTTRHPVGVAGCITPWNFPVAIPGWKVFPALLMGNGVVLKPSELAPACAEAFVEALVAAGIPPGLVQVVHGGAATGTALVEHPGIGAVSFTGSVPTGRAVAARAMETGPRIVALELGGKNAMVVLPDADLELVVDGAIWGAFGTAGQRCTSTSRLVVHREVADDVVSAVSARAAQLVLGDPLDPVTDVGPVITRAAAERIRGVVEQAATEGAEVVEGGHIVGVEGCAGAAFFEPTVLRSVSPDHRVACEEVFGPVLAVIEVDSLEEAVEVVNGVEYGLSTAIYTRDVNQALRAAERVDSGIVYVNAPTIGAEVHLPFGGSKHTGNGYREAGTRGLEQFSQLKVVYVDYSGRLQRAQIDSRPPVTG